MLLVYLELIECVVVGLVVEVEKLVDFVDGK